MELKDLVESKSESFEHDHLQVTITFRVVEDLDVSMLGLSATDDSVYNVQGILNNGMTTGSLNQIVEELEKMYCGPLAVEYQHIPVSRFYDCLHCQHLDTPKLLHSKNIC